MELGEYGSLDFVIREANPGPTPLQKRHLTLDIALGLRAIHHAGFIHGDLKADNVLIMAHNDPHRRFVAKLIDFGGSSSDRPIHFTPLWSAPEVVNEDHDINWEKADVYSFGLIIASLWARPDPRPDMALSNSCILSWYTDIYPDGFLTKPVLFGIKSSPNGCVQLFNFIMENYNTAGGLDRSEVLDILTPTLHPHYWQRPNTEDLVQLLIPFGERMGRSIPQEESVAGNRSTQRSRSDQELVGSGLARIAELQVELMKEFVLEEYSTILKGVESSLPGDSMRESFDIPAHDIDHDKFIECLYNTMRVLAPNALRTYAKPCDLIKHLQLQDLTWCLADLHFSLYNLLGHRDTAFEWMRISALCGSRKAIHFAVLADMGTASRIPVLPYLLGLALSRSDLALQRLSEDWPDHFKIIREIILTKRLDHKVLDELFPLHVLTAYRDPIPDVELGITMRQALEVGSLPEIEKILDGRIRAPDLDEILPSLLHGLSRLVDTEARPLAKIAFERGAKLYTLLPCKSPILGCEPLEQICVPPPAAYSPLSSAIIRGKTTLAMAIFCLHVETETPIPDFSAALSLSFRYLHHELGECLLDLLRENPSMCLDTARLWETNKAPLHELLIVAMSRDGPTEYERRAINGSKFDSNYEKCLQLLLREGVDPTQGAGTTCPFYNALWWDDVIGLRLFMQHIQQYGSDSAVLGCIMDPGHTRTGDKNLPQALITCIERNSFRCLEFLLGSFPYLVSEELGESGYTLLHHACRIPRNMDSIRVLLDSGIEVNTSRHPGGCITPLFEALQYGNLPAADLLASRRPDDLVELVSRDATGGSIFYALIVDWVGHGRTDHLGSFRWLANHNGIHFYGPADVSVWGLVFFRPRPTSRPDQILEADLLDFLLGLDQFRTRINDPSIGGLTLIQAVAMHGHAEAVKVLLNKGADANARGTHDSLKELSAIDFAYLAFNSYPDSIKAAGSLEIQEWKEDMISTINLLRKDADDSSTASPRWFMETMASFAREHIAPQRLLNGMFRRCQFHGDWPRQISPITGSNSMEELSLSEISMNAILNNDSFTNPSGNAFPIPGLKVTFSPEFVKCGQELRASLEKAQKLRDSMKHTEADKQDAWSIVRKLWRLPPNWDLLRIRGVVEMIYFINRENMQMVYEKPAFYRGGGDETIRPDRKGKGKDVAIVHQDPNRWFIDLVISPRTASATSSAELNVSCSLIRIEPNLDCSNHQQDDGLTIYAKESWIGEILHATIVSDNLENLAAMVDAVGDVEQTDWENLTPLQQAAVHGRDDMASILIAYGGQVNRMYPEDGLLPLHVSIRNNNTSMVQMLLDNGADPNGKTRDGIPPLHFCLAQHDEPEIVRALIHHRADLQMIAQNATPLEIAISYDRQQSLDVLQEAYEDMDEVDSDDDISSDDPAQMNEASTSTNSESLCPEDSSRHDSEQLSQPTTVS